MEKDNRKAVARLFTMAVPALLWICCVLVPHSSMAAGGRISEIDALHGLPAIQMISAKAKPADKNNSHQGKKISGKKTPKKASKKKLHHKKSESVQNRNIGVFTAYTSKAGKGTKATHETADGTNLKETESCVVANNKLPFGTKIKIDGIGTCEVRDRLKKRAGANRFDIHLSDNHKWAKNFGKRKLKYSIEKEGEAARS